MFSLTTVATLALSAFCVSPVSAAVHDIIVGGSAGLVFTPEAIFANVGDSIVFHFQAKNHSVQQSSLAAPCSQKEGGFDSGFIPVAANQTDNFPTFAINVTTTDPIWAFCNQAANTATFHCGKGMVFSANCGADGQANSFTNFKNSALAIGSQLAASASASPTASPAASATTDTLVTSTITQTVTSASSTWTTTYATAIPTQVAASSSNGTVINVTVGGNGSLAFDPPHVAAQAGDIVRFSFVAKNHSIVQSTFAAPCRQLNNATTGQVGFNSGYQPIASGAAAVTWDLLVNDSSTPVWAYCSQTNHCGAGMVFAINSVESSNKSWSDFQTLAKQLNGTATNGTAANATTSGSAAASSNTAASGADVVRVGTTGLAATLGVVAVVLSFL